jgi:hypothetical protein
MHTIDTCGTQRAGTNGHGSPDTVTTGSRDRFVPAPQERKLTHKVLDKPIPNTHAHTRYTHADTSRSSSLTIHDNYEPTNRR